MLDWGRNFSYICVTGETTCFGFDRGRQLKCLIAIFRAAFILFFLNVYSSFYFEEKSENIEIHRNDSERIGNSYLRMNYELCRVLWWLFITVRGEAHSSFHAAASAIGIPLLNGVYQRWGGKPPPQRFTLANQSQSNLGLVHTPCPVRPRDAVWLVHSWGFMGGVSCHSSWLPCSSLFGSFWQN